MQTYTRNMLHNAWTIGCADIAAKISTRVWEAAKYGPDTFRCEEKIFIQRIMAEEILKVLKNNFLQVDVSMDYQPEDNFQGMAKYRFDWS